jgi:tRNA(Ile2) C34 agmatinyltransferase TiaS
MRVLVAVDDTDNLETKGTGHLAEAIACGVEQKGWGTRSYVTRHQLLVHPDVPYTSHNSSMCFAVDLSEAHLEELTSDAAALLERESAPGSDPGLCLAVPERLNRTDELVAFGERAKRTVLEKEEAHDLARRLGIHLSAHGGTGGGVIGALAAVGLRLGGNDGRLRGHVVIEKVDANGVTTVRDLRAHPHITSVRTLDGVVLRDDEAVLLSDWKVKPVMQGGTGVLLVTESSSEEARWQTCPRSVLKSF